MTPELTRREAFKGAAAVTATAALAPLGAPADAAPVPPLLMIEERLPISSGEKVRVSSFGSFVLRDKRERMGRNPRTGDPAAISPRRVIVFRPSRILKSRIQEGVASIGIDA